MVALRRSFLSILEKTGGESSADRRRRFRNRPCGRDSVCVGRVHIAPPYLNEHQDAAIAKHVVKSRRVFQRHDPTFGEKCGGRVRRQ